MMSDIQLKGSPNQGMWGATLGFFIGFAAVVLFGVTAKNLKELMDLNPVQMGFLVAMPNLSGSLLRIPFAAWVDTTGGRKPLIILLLLSIIGMAGLYVTLYVYFPDNVTFSLYPLLLIWGLLCGCGIAVFSVGISQTSYWFPKSRQGQALGIFGGVGNLAPGIFSLVLPMALTSIGFISSYFIWLIFLVLGTIIYLIIGSNAYYFQYLHAGKDKETAKNLAAENGQELFPARSLMESLKLSASESGTWALVFVYFITFGGFLALMGWFSNFWQTYYGFPSHTAGYLTAAFGISASLIRVVAGSVSDRVGGKTSVVYSLIILAIGSLLMMLARTWGLTFLGAMIIALGMGAGNAATFKLVPQVAKKAVGGAAGWIGGLGAFGGFVIPPILGRIVESMSGEAGYPMGYVVFLVLSVLAILVVLPIKRQTN